MGGGRVRARRETDNKDAYTCQEVGEVMGASVSPRKVFGLYFPRLLGCQVKAQITFVPN